MGEPAARHAAQARDEAGVMTFPDWPRSQLGCGIVQLVDARGDPAFVAAHWPQSSNAFFQRSELPILNATSSPF